VIQLAIRDELWNDLKAVAAREKKSPELLARRALREYVRRMADEELLERSHHVARRASFSIEDSEKVVRRYRRKK
jgi:predicted transcriptional regulator